MIINFFIFVNRTQLPIELGNFMGKTTFFKALGDCSLSVWLTQLVKALTRVAVCKCVC